MDIKELIEKLAESVLNDEAIKAKFTKDPIKAVEQVLGVDLPDDIVEKVIDGVKAKITVDQISDAASFLKKLF